MRFQPIVLCFLILFTINSVSQTKLLDRNSKKEISFATISFGNGNGLFANQEGVFVFTKKRYADIDSLYISALGYKNEQLATSQIKDTLYLSPKASLLDEVIVNSKPSGKFKKKTINAIKHDNYYNCWLPTIESEIAVLFPNNTKNIKHLTTVLLPIKTESKDWNKKSVKKRPFSTLFRVQFYENNKGKPGTPLTYQKALFIATENTKSLFEFDVSKLDIYVPKKGVFVSVQVLGYTDKDKKLLHNKKYKEVKTKRGIVKVSTTFRPLLPFTNKIQNKNTFVKRLFLNEGKWVLFDKKNIKNSTLLNAGLNNYGMGIKMNVYKIN